MTPAQRRFLATSRASQDEEQPPAADNMAEAAAALLLHATRDDVEATIERSQPGERTADRRRGAIDLRAQQHATDSHTLRNTLLGFSLLFSIAIIFYAGRRYDYLKYLVTTRLQSQSLDQGVDKYPNASVDELISTGLAAEKRGAWEEAADRFLSAKRKNLALPGILYHIGKTSFDRSDLANADAALAQAIRLKENVAPANYYRGLIAIRRHDLAAATQFFEAGAAGEPFLAEMYYNWAEALRLNQHPRDSIRRYQQAIERNPNPPDVALCEFKIRLARIEATEGEKVRAEVEAHRAAGPLTVDWLMTDAALKMQTGAFTEAAQLISAARTLGDTGLFLACAGDSMFTTAAATHEEIRSAFGTVVTP